MLRNGMAVWARVMVQCGAAWLCDSIAGWSFAGNSNGNVPKI